MAGTGTQWTNTVGRLMAEPLLSTPSTVLQETVKFYPGGYKEMSSVFAD
jgi:hypothetical protein